MKVTYLIGAGGSCGTIPLARELGRDIGPLSESIKNDLLSFYQKGVSVYPEDRRPPPRGTYGSKLFESMQWLHETALNHNSVDTIARKLWMRGDPDSLEMLRKLKAVLTAYLWYRQISRPSDRKYDTFFATILQKKGQELPVLPRPISILTWNYDLLIERSFFEYCRDYGHTINHLLSENRIIHLNGFASVEPSVKSSILQNDYSKFQFALFHDCDDRFASIIELFDRCLRFHPPERLETMIRFAWENSAISAEAARITQGTTILVVVGYSFPYFNRDTDKLILEAVVPAVSRIYLQVTQSIGPKERMLSILNEISPTQSWAEMIQDVKDAEEVYIPNELIQ